MRSTGDGEFAVAIDEQWSVGAKPNGGYLLAVLATAAADHAGGRHPHPTAVSGSFLTAPHGGPASVWVSTLRAGRGATQLHARMTQDGQPCVDALVTLGTLPDGDPWWTSAAAVDLPAELDCVRQPPHVPGTDMKLPLMEVLEQRLDPAALRGRTGTGTIAGWQRLADGTDWDPFSLLVALDSLPPVSLDLGMSGWVPTVQFTAYLRGLPAPGPLRTSVRAHQINGDRMDEAAFTWDSKGRLVGQATQIAGVRIPES
ncbi:MAG TPA: thioesterase family protein [Pseudonocardiaceae bacterium]|nr:thioesterase family protein [Pseudonocardiaceae bacterium]